MDDQIFIAFTYSSSRARVCTMPLSAWYSLMTRARSSADGNTPRSVTRVLPPRSSIGPHRPHQVARRVDQARSDDGCRVYVEVDAIFFGHASSPAFSPRARRRST